MGHPSHIYKSQKKLPSYGEFSGSSVRGSGIKEKPGKLKKTSNADFRSG
jgi:hypothetical protein